MEETIQEYLEKNLHLFIQNKWLPVSTAISYLNGEITPIELLTEVNGNYNDEKYKQSINKINYENK
jgi:hypothetical protein